VFNYILYRLYTGCQWDALPIAADPQHPDQKEISSDAVAYHFRKWCRDGSLNQVWQNSIAAVRELVDVAELNLDGSHTIAKKGGESVAYQGRKKAKTSNILPLTDKKGYVIASTTIVAGNHNDAFELKENLVQLFNDLKQQQINIKGAYFNADSAFDTKAARKVCFNYRVVPNIPENLRNRKLRKLVFILAGEASAAFSLELGAVACFDARLPQLPTLRRLVDDFRWRSEDGHRARHAAGVRVSRVAVRYTRACA
jgi:transposase